jgi:hypothetical protein
MTFEQEEALYDFLMDRIEPFSLKEVASVVRAKGFYRAGRLANEIAGLINTQNLAFEISTNKWITRGGCFFDARFVISPTRVELLNGILIPGHRCVPFAKPDIPPQDYTFYWKGKPIPMGTTEAAPEEFYPFYSIFGEEYGPQYIAGDNEENEQAFNDDPSEDPSEVSIKTVDMRQVYREGAFIPGDHFIVRSLDWKAGSFSLEKAEKDAWARQDLDAWFTAAEAGFLDSFELLGTGSSTEEQIAFAYWYGSKRMRETPAYSLENFLYELTDKIETVGYGIETRFWYAGRDIPDYKKLQGIQTQADQTPIEEFLARSGVPISEYVIQSYVRDAIFHHENDIDILVTRVVPTTIPLDKWGWNLIAAYLIDVLEEWRDANIVFSDKVTGPIRRRLAELHTAVIDLAAQLEKGNIDPSWLPKHTFIVLSQIQIHAAGLLEDFAFSEELEDMELDSIDNALENMIETYEELKEMIDKSLDNFRRGNISLVNIDHSETGAVWRTVQISIGGTDIWRRVEVPQAWSLEYIHRLIQVLFGWTSSMRHRFTVQYTQFTEILDEEKALRTNLNLGELSERLITEMIYEYGRTWTVKVMMLGRFEAEAGKKPRCVAGAYAAPSETVEGPLRFRRFLSALDLPAGPEKETALSYLGKDFDIEAFNLAACNKLIEQAL